MYTDFLSIPGNVGSDIIGFTTGLGTQILSAEVEKANQQIESLSRQLETKKQQLQNAQRDLRTEQNLVRQAESEQRNLERQLSLLNNQLSKERDQIKKMEKLKAQTSAAVNRVTELRNHAGVRKLTKSITIKIVAAYWPNAEGPYHWLSTKILGAKHFYTICNKFAQ